MTDTFDPNDPTSLATLVKASVDAYLERRLAPLAARVKEMETRGPVVGEKGEKGDPGEKGASGDVGPAGPVGEQGPAGEKGADGAPGRDGRDGVDGAAGEKGEKGDPGEVGAMGPIGEKGERGEKGDPGIDGKDGAPGPQGQKGMPGEPGQDGRDGKEGAPGRDALRIEIAEGIDVGRSHARGTYATHLGGLWRALRPTDAVAEGATAEQLQTAGWQVVVNGIADMSVNLGTDMRTVNVGLMTTDGRAQMETLSLPTLVYRSLYVRGKEYEPGDLVTWDGSAWHCEAKTTDEPGTTPTWKLFARKGRDRTAT